MPFVLFNAKMTSTKSMCPTWLLEHRFGALPTRAIDKLNSAPEQDLETWDEAVLTVPTLDAVFDESKPH
jgi:hypothetical protein